MEATRPSVCWLVRIFTSRRAKLNTHFSWDITRGGTPQLHTPTVCCRDSNKCRYLHLHFYYYLARLMQSNVHYITISQNRYIIVLSTIEQPIRQSSRCDADQNVSIRRCPPAVLLVTTRNYVLTTMRSELQWNNKRSMTEWHASILYVS